MTIGGADIVRTVDELPLVAVLGAYAEGDTVLADAAELRVKESDRIASMAAGLRAMGASVDTTPDGLVVRGTGGLRGASVDAAGDHRIAMALAVAGLAAEGATADLGVGVGRDLLSRVPHRRGRPGRTLTAGARRSPRVKTGRSARRARPSKPIKRRPIIVAIDGPAGSGKTTVAKGVARALGLERLDTGAMYRALTLKALREGIDPSEGRGLAALARRTRFEHDERGLLVDGRRPSRAIRSPEVNRSVSEVAAHPGVRKVLVGPAARDHGAVAGSSRRAATSGRSWPRRPM